MATKASVKPVIVFVFSKNRGPKSTRYKGFANRLKNRGALEGIKAKVVALEDLVFTIKNKDSAEIIDTATGENIFKNASLVYFKSWESMPEPASAVAAYLTAKGIPYFDETVGDAGLSKLPHSFRIWAAGAPVVPTIALTKPVSEELVKQVCGDGPYILKIANGQKGRNNHLINDLSEIDKILDGSTWYLLQPFIQNDGDYRVLVYGGRVRGALWRHGRQEGSYLNNTSLGAKSDWVEADELPEGIADIAKLAAKCTRHQIAGVDIVVDQNGKQYVLEVNQGAQIATGGRVDKKIEAFSDFLHEAIQQRHPRTNQKRLRPIGRTVRISMPELGLYDILSKVDTGAYQSALHARDITEFTKEDGTKMVRFTVDSAHDQFGAEHPITTEAEFVEKVRVVSSNSQEEYRYVVKVVVSLVGKRYTTGMTLTDRTNMTIPILLGRRFLRGRFVVNPELGSKGIGK